MGTAPGIGAVADGSDLELHERVAGLAADAGEPYEVAAVRYLRSRHSIDAMDQVRMRLAELLRWREARTGVRSRWLDSL